MTHQEQINQYHEEISHHHDMHVFHANWHRQNPDPARPPTPDPNWGADTAFGQRFLQMHHEMVKARDSEPKQFMNHPSIASWHAAKGYALPSEWNPLTAIPDELAHEPNPPTITLPSGQVFDLHRATNSPMFALPKYFTAAGIGSGENPEPITRARKLSDFRNVNQLGCCIVFPHNSWHGRIGGSMSFFNTAINDPIFYFGVHWHIDKVFDAYKALLEERVGAPLRVDRIETLTMPERTEVAVPSVFSEEEKRLLREGEGAGRTLRSLL